MASAVDEQAHDRPAALALEDGRVFQGRAFGATSPIGGSTKTDHVDNHEWQPGAGEVVFNTAMTGYQEICTDPSYRGEIVCLTYPLIGNYGANPGDDESRRPWLAGLVIRNLSPLYSHWRATESLHSYLTRWDVPGIHDLDTRALVRHLRTQGLQRGVIVHFEPQAATRSDAELAEMARQVAHMPGEQNVVGQVSAPSIYRYDPIESVAAAGLRVAVLDCGLKENILRSLARRGIEAIVLPYGAPLSDILALQPDALINSPGPGDPERNDATIATIRGAIEHGLPFMGICLGHQLLGLAIGATTSRLRYGHRGGNHPVKDIVTGNVYITSQNHGYQVNAASVPVEAGWRVSQINLNDGSVEGLGHLTRPVFSVQYHPEGAPGPQDNQYLFDRFLSLVSDAHSPAV